MSTKIILVDTMIDVNSENGMGGLWEWRSLFGELRKKSLLAAGMKDDDARHTCIPTHPFRAVVSGGRGGSGCCLTRCVVCQLSKEGYKAYLQKLGINIPTDKAYKTYPDHIDIWVVHKKPGDFSHNMMPSRGNAYATIEYRMDNLGMEQEDGSVKEFDMHSGPSWTATDTPVVRACVSKSEAARLIKLFLCA